MVIYTITNLINGKVYIGKTNNFRKRKNSHLCLLNRGVHYNTYLQRSWDKYGSDNVKFDIIDADATSYEDLSEREQYYIKLSRSWDQDFGYNMTLGGEGSLFTKQRRDALSQRMKGVPKSEEQKKKMSIASKGKSKDRIYTDEQRKVISENLRKQVQSEETKKKRALKQTGSGNHRYGKTGSLSASFGKPNVNRFKVDCFTKDGTLVRTFDCVADAGKYLGVNGSNISGCLHGRQKTVKGFIFKKRGQ